MPEIQVTLTGKRYSEFSRLKRDIEANTGLKISNPQVIDFLMNLYKKEYKANP